MKIEEIEMGFWSSIGGAISSGLSAVGRVASSVWEASKEVAGKAIGWLAEKAEGFVGGVKKVWEAMKPYVEHIRVAIRAAAAAVPIPWLQGALLMLDRGIGALTKFENSPIAKKIDSAIQWAIKLAKRWQSNGSKAESTNCEESILDEEELAEAKRHQENLRFAERELSEDQRHNLELTSAINDFSIAKTDLNNTIDTGVKDFEHYLRLRATQKLLRMIETRFETAKNIDELSADDLFLTRIASDLIKEEPELNKEAASRLDRLLTERYGKKLTPFVFEELIASWAKRAEDVEKLWNEENQKYSKDSTLFNRLTTQKKIQIELSPEEDQLLINLGNELPDRKLILNSISEQQNDLTRYVGAAEGFLQLLENSPEEIEQQGRGYLIEEGAKVGKLLISCAENNTNFRDLSNDEKSMLTDYANIFKIDSRNRMKKILEITA